MIRFNQLYFLKQTILRKEKNIFINSKISSIPMRTTKICKRLDRNSNILKKRMKKQKKRET